MSKTVTMHGNPLDLTGNDIQPGSQCPDCELTANDLSGVKLSSYKGKVVIISCVPSLDTPVCDTETRKFNEKVGDLGDGAVLLTVSMDLPFAQARWCGLTGVGNVVTLSDHRTGELGESFGVMLEGPRLLARAIFVVDKQGVIQYKQLVEELTNEPDYDAVINAAKELL